MPTDPLVAVGVPVRNGAALLARALAALSAQTYPSLRIVISDNASTDSTAQVIADAAAGDARITSSRLPDGVAVEDNFVRVARACADAPLFMWAAHDDLWQPDHVERLVEALRERPDAGLAAFDTRVVREDGALGGRCESAVLAPPCCASAR